MKKEKSFKIQFANKTLSFPVWHDENTTAVKIDWQDLVDIGLEKKDYISFRNMLEKIIYDTLGYEQIFRVSYFEKQLMDLATAKN